MDAQTRILKTLDHEEPDKVPYFEIAITNKEITTHYGFTPGSLGKALAVARFLPFRKKIVDGAVEKREIVVKGMRGLVKFYKDAGIDMIPSVTALFPRKLTKGGFIDEFGRNMHFEYYKDGTEILGYLGGHFKSFEDYEAWDQPDPNWIARLSGFLAGRDVQKELKDEVFVIPSTTGMMEVSWESFGFETFARILTRSKQAKKVFDDRGKFMVESVKILAENDAKLILVYDDYGFKNGLFMSPKQYKEHVFPWLKRGCAAAHERGAKILLHSDGDLSAILDDIVNDCHVDALNPIEPTTANPDYSIFDIKKRFGDKLSLVGNVSPVMLATGTISEIEAYTKRLMLEIAPGGGYILASGHTINPVVTVDRWQAMLAIREKLGHYPIQGSIT
nr:uroporphyrinogen decarboxylase family protein [Candidatus Sigynarchaeota archaeon]